MQHPHLQLVVKSAEPELIEALTALAEGVDGSRLARLWAACESSPLPAALAQQAAMPLPEATCHKRGKDLHELVFTGAAAGLLSDWLAAMTNGVFWARLSSGERETWLFNDGAGFSRRRAHGVAGEPEPAELDWYASMGKPLRRLFTDETDDALERRLLAHKLDKNTVDHQARFVERHRAEADLMFVRVRIPKKGERVPLLRRLRRYVDEPGEETYRALADYFTGLMDGHEYHEGCEYPDWDSCRQAPEELARGLVFVEEAGNYIHCGYCMGNMRPYLLCEDYFSSDVGRHAPNLTHHFSWFTDSVEGIAIHRNFSTGLFERFSIFSNCGYRYMCALRPEKMAV